MCVNWRSAEGGSVNVPGQGRHLVFVGIVVVMLSFMVIISSVWTSFDVFVAERGWKVALVVIVFTPAVQEPGSEFGLRGWQWLVISEVSAMVGE